MDHLDDNLKIISLIEAYAWANPKQRFHQILQNLNIESKETPDLFYQDSYITFNTMRKPQMLSEDDVEELEYQIGIVSFLSKQIFK